MAVRLDPWKNLVGVGWGSSEWRGWLTAEFAGIDESDAGAVGYIWYYDGEGYYVGSWEGLLKGYSLAQINSIGPVSPGVYSFQFIMDGDHSASFLDGLYLHVSGYRSFKFGDGLNYIGTFFDYNLGYLVTAWQQDDASPSQMALGLHEVVLTTNPSYIPGS